MNRDDCEKLLDATLNAWMLYEQSQREKLDEQFAREAAENLRDVVIGIMAGGGEKTWREPYIGKPVVVPATDKTTTLPYNPMQGYTHVTASCNQPDDRYQSGKNVVTCGVEQ